MRRSDRRAGRPTSLHFTNRLTDHAGLCTFTHMVESEINALGTVFHALGDPTRRQMLQVLAAGERTVSELAGPFAMSLAAASKHIKVLEGAGLIRRENPLAHPCLPSWRRVRSPMPTSGSAPTNGSGPRGSTSSTAFSARRTPKTPAKPDPAKPEGEKT